MPPGPAWAPRTLPARLTLATPLPERKVSRGPGAIVHWPESTNRTASGGHGETPHKPRRTSHTRRVTMLPGASTPVVAETNAADPRGLLFQGLVRPLEQRDSSTRRQWRASRQLKLPHRSSTKPHSPGPTTRCKPSKRASPQRQPNSIRNSKTPAPPHLLPRASQRSLLETLARPGANPSRFSSCMTASSNS